MTLRSTRRSVPQSPQVHRRPTTVRMLSLAAVVVLAGGALAACGSDSDSSGTTPTTDQIDANAAGAGDKGATVEVSTTDLGDVLVDGEGQTLYLFTPDGTGAPTCVDTCADAWPPLVSSGEPVVEGIEDGVIATVDAPDGTTQVTAGGHPLYTYAGDTAPGDTSGQGSGGKWFVVGADGAAIDTTDTSGGSGY